MLKLPAELSQITVHNKELEKEDIKWFFFHLERNIISAELYICSDDKYC